MNTLFSFTFYASKVQAILFSLNKTLKKCCHPTYYELRVYTYLKCKLMIILFSHICWGCGGFSLTSTRRIIIINIEDSFSPTNRKHTANKISICINEITVLSVNCFYLCNICIISRFTP